MILIDGSEAKNGDVIAWKCFDNDDCTTWDFTGLVTPKGVVYLGGGIDYGMAIGSIYALQEVIEESENNDPDERGISKEGVAFDLAYHIGRFGS